MRCLHCSKHTSISLFTEPNTAQHFLRELQPCAVSFLCKWHQHVRPVCGVSRCHTLVICDLQEPSTVGALFSSSTQNYLPPQHKPGHTRPQSLQRGGSSRTAAHTHSSNMYNYTTLGPNSPTVNKGKQMECWSNQSQLNLQAALMRLIMKTGLIDSQWDCMSTFAVRTLIGCCVFIYHTFVHQSASCHKLKSKNKLTIFGRNSFGLMSPICRIKTILLQPLQSCKHAEMCYYMCMRTIYSNIFLLSCSLKLDLDIPRYFSSSSIFLFGRRGMSIMFTDLQASSSCAFCVREV